MSEEEDHDTQTDPTRGCRGPAPSTMKKILALIASVRFFVLVALVLALVALAASFVPQGLPEGEYDARFGSALSAVIRATGLHRVHSSPLLLALIALTEVSLLACTLPRLVRRIRRRGAVSLSAFAPDAIHVGLAIVIAGGFAQLAFGEEWRYEGPIGGELVVDAQRVEVRTAGELSTERGALAGWYIEVAVDGERVRFGSNDPVNAAVGRLHFQNYAERGFVTLAAGEQEVELQVGEGVGRRDGGALVVLSVDEGTATFADVARIPEGQAALSAAVRNAPRLALNEGDTVGSLGVAGLRTETHVAFTVGRNPGRGPVLAGLLLVAAGLGVFATARIFRRQ